jgi:glucosamine-6-phosphate deaminase
MADKTQEYKLIPFVGATRDEMGARAAADIAAEIRSLQAKQKTVRIIFAAAPSQEEMLAALRKEPEIDWKRVTAFHMDEYIGLPPGARQRFAQWLKLHIFDHLPFGEVNLIDPGKDPKATAEAYAGKLKAAPIDIVCCGIGTNGHLAFNDPPADFDDPLTVKVVELDLECRRQQVEDECFATLKDVPTHALSVTIPGLLSARKLFCTVPGTMKREAVRRTLTEAVNPMCPATILKTHPGVKLYLDKNSAGDAR